MVNICVGPPINPCICNDSGCSVSCTHLLAVLSSNLHNSVIKKGTLVMVHCVQEIVIMICCQMLSWTVHHLHVQKYEDFLITTYYIVMHFYSIG